MDGAGLRDRRLVAYALCWPQADPAELHAAAGRGRLPLFTRAPAGEQRGCGTLPRRARGARRTAQPLRRGDRELVAAHAQAKAAELVPVVLRAARDHLSLYRGISALLF